MRSVTTITPQRITFVGGGTDFFDYYHLNGGKCLSSTIDNYLYVTVKHHGNLFDENYRLNYSSTELCSNISEIKNNIARECLNLVPIDPPLFISTISDLPSSSGLASSSCFAVGFLHALHILRGESVSAGQLAEEACHVEINMLNSPIGKQDQYAAAFGGMNKFIFHKNNRVSHDHLWLPNDGIESLFSRIMLFWTNIQRDSSSILTVQHKLISQNLNHLNYINDMIDPFVSELLSITPSYKILGEILLDGWKSKLKLSSNISNQFINDAMHTALSLGAYGGKIVGAGGGGFLMLLVEPEYQSRVKEGLRLLKHVPISYESQGTRILSTF